MLGGGAEQAGRLALDQGVGRRPADLMVIAVRSHEAIHLGPLAAGAVADGKGLGRAQGRAPADQADAQAEQASDQGCDRSIGIEATGGQARAGGHESKRAEHPRGVAPKVSGCPDLSRRCRASPGACGAQPVRNRKSGLELPSSASDAVGHRLCAPWRQRFALKIKGGPRRSAARRPGRIQSLPWQLVATLKALPGRALDCRR